MAEGKSFSCAGRTILQMMRERLERERAKSPVDTAFCDGFYAAIRYIENPYTAELPVEQHIIPLPYGKGR